MARAGARRSRRALMAAMPMPTPPPARGAAPRAPERWLDATLDFVQRVWRHCGEDDVLFLASGISFDLLLAIVPFALLVISGLGYFLNQSAAASIVTVNEVVNQFLPAQRGDPSGPLARILGDVVRTRGSTGLVGAITFVWFSTRLFASLRSALDRVFGFFHARRGIIAGKFLDIRVTIYATLLIVAWTMVSAYVAFGHAREHNLGAREGWFTHAEFLAGRIFAVAVLVYTFWSLYRHLPSRKVRRRTAFISAVFTTTLFEIARSLFSVYVQALDPGSLYTNTLRTIIVVMFWIYYAGIMFTLGGEVGRVYELRRAERLGTEPWT